MLLPTTPSWSVVSSGSGLVADAPGSVCLRHTHPHDRGPEMSGRHRKIDMFTSPAQESKR